MGGDSVREFLKNNEFGLAFDALQRDSDGGYSQMFKLHMDAAKELMDKGWK